MATKTTTAKFKLSPELEVELQRALKFYEDFHWGLKSKKITGANLVVPEPNEALVMLGRTRGIIYETPKGGEDPHQFYIHAFDPSFPILACDAETRRQLFFVGGRYKVTARGIEH